MKNIHVITGGSSGIGLECAKLFKDGIVLLSGRSEDKLKASCGMLEELGIEAKYKASDVSDQEKVKALMSYAKELGNLKTVVHSAGVSGTGGDAMKTLKIDLLGSYNIIEETYNSIGENTALILISSMMGHVVPANEDYDEALRNPEREGSLEKLVSILDGDSDKAYNFAKHGVQLLAKTNASRFGKMGARIISVSPGIIMTPMSKKAAEEHPEQMQYMQSITAVGRNGEPEDIAEAVYFLASDKASFITGTDILIDGGLTLNLKKEEQKLILYNSHIDTQRQR